MDIGLWMYFPNLVQLLHVGVYEVPLHGFANLHVLEQTKDPGSSSMKRLILFCGQLGGPWLLWLKLRSSGASKWSSFTSSLLFWGVFYAMDDLFLGVF